ncbi:MAG: endo-1,4-beta-xylanase [Dysgonamonadaceae bacterium]|jgi:endo-1,4-beta-xylanase|nr:endo-1,4-beta-xylanase [Dysgonamonadaceae bacterium]
MKKIILFSAICFSLTACFFSNVPEKRTALKEAFKDKFLIGTAVNVEQSSGADTQGVAVIREQFNAITPENCMKSMYLQPEEGRFFFDEADQFVDFGLKNKLFMTGHCLIWHSQAPEWFFIDKEGKDVSREVLIERMKNHISTVVGRYKGKIKSWDVVNEAIMDDGSWRESKFYRIIGEDFIPLAFQFAHEADPGAELYYNDYSMANEGKRNTVIRLVKSLQEKGLRIDGVGMQAHLSMDFPPIDEFEKSLLTFSVPGVKVMITELDLGVLPNPKKDVGANISDTYEYRQEMNPYAAGLPDSVYIAWSNRLNDFFKLFLKHHDKISRVTMWGVSDRDSWKNNWPIPGRTDYPLLFDREYRAKPIVNEIIEETIKRN